MTVTVKHCVPRPSGTFHGLRRTCLRLLQLGAWACLFSAPAFGWPVYVVGKGVYVPFLRDYVRTTIECETLDELNNAIVKVTRSGGGVDIIRLSRASDLADVGRGLVADWARIGLEPGTLWLPPEGGWPEPDAAVAALPRMDERTLYVNLQLAFFRYPALDVVGPLILTYLPWNSTPAPPSGGWVAQAAYTNHYVAYLWQAMGPGAISFNLRVANERMELAREREAKASEAYAAEVKALREEMASRDARRAVWHPRMGSLRHSGRLPDFHQLVGYPALWIGYGEHGARSERRPGPRPAGPAVMVPEPAGLLGAPALQAGSFVRVASSSSSSSTSRSPSDLSPGEPE